MTKVRAHSGPESSKTMSDIAQLQSIVESAYGERDQIGTSTGGAVREAVDEALDRLDSGALRVAE